MNLDRQVSLNLNIRGLGQSATLASKLRCAELRRAGRTIYDFGLGQSPFPVPACVVEALRLAAPEKDYLPVRGLPALCDTVAAFHRRVHRVEVSPERVLIGPGSKELMFLLQLVYYGEIMLVTPCWVSYLPQARILGRRISLLHTRADANWKLSAEQLEKAIALTGDEKRPRLLVLNYPSNPTGTGFAAAELQAIADVARKYELVVLSDEIYGRLHFHDQHVSIAQYYPEGTIISSGLSKWCGAGGWRLGTFAFPAELDWLADAMAVVASETYTSVSAPIQHAAIRAFVGGLDIELYLQHARRILAALAQRSVAHLTAAGIHVAPPDGAFYLYLDFNGLGEKLHARGIHTSEELCNRILEETGVAILPASAFGRSRSELAARLAYVDFDGARALAASETHPLDQPLPDALIEPCCEQVMTGVRKLAAWAAE